MLVLTFGNPGQNKEHQKGACLQLCAPQGCHNHRAIDLQFFSLIMKPKSSLVRGPGCG